MEKSNLPKLKSEKFNLKTSISFEIIVFELLKTFSIPIDIFTLNRTILNEVINLTNATFASIIHFNELGNVKYIQKSNGAFEKKIDIPNFYAQQFEPLIANINTCEQTFNRYEGFRQILIIPFYFASKLLCILEIFFKDEIPEKKVKEFLSLASIIEKCSILALINLIIKTYSNYDMLENNVLIKPDNRLLNDKFFITRLTFSEYIKIISELLYLTCPTEYSAILWFDKKNANYRIVHEKSIFKKESNNGLKAYRNNSLKFIEKAIKNMSILNLNQDNKLITDYSEPITTLVIPIMNFKFQSGGIVLINKIVNNKIEEFNYNDQLVALVLTNYLGEFYKNFINALELENKIQSYSLIYEISNANNNLFNIEDFKRSIKNVLSIINQYLNIPACVLVFYDNTDKTLNIFSSFENDISIFVEQLLKDVKMDFWNIKDIDLKDKDIIEDLMFFNIIKLSEVGIFKEAISKFKNNILNSCGNLSDYEYEINLMPISFQKKMCGYLMLIDNQSNVSYNFIFNDSDQKNNEFLNAMLNIVISLIKAQKNYLKINELEKKALKMERLAAIGMVAAAIAHEIRNPLGGILLFTTSLLSHFDKNDNKRKWLEQIIDAVNRISNIVSNLLNYSKEENLFLANNNLIKIILDAMYETTNSFTNLKINLNVNFIKILQNELITVDNTLEINLHCDKIKLKQVFINLFQNSINAIIQTNNYVQDEIKNQNCDIDIIIDDSKNDHLILYVCDFGPGIALEIQNKIFQPFFTTHSKGTGLGLAIVQKIIEAHNGSIELVNNDLFFSLIKTSKKYGAIFKIVLPIMHENKSN